MVAKSENKVKLTKRLVDSTQANLEKRYSIWDNEIQGFHLRIYPTGRKVYYLQYRNAQKITRKINIGLHGNITTEKARDIAQRLALKVASGLDPAEQSKELKEAPTMNMLCEEYLDLHSRVNKRSESLRNDLSMINNIVLPALGNLKLEQITSHDLQRLHKDLVKTPYRANRVKALLSKMFSLAIEWGWCSENPAVFVKKYQEEKRTRWLNEEELKSLWTVLDTYHTPSVAIALKLLLLTGARKKEVLSAAWNQFDLERGIWTKPAHMTKQKREEFLPLSLEAINLLDMWRKYSTGEFVFPGKVEGQPLQDIKKAWNTIRSTANLEGVRIHDLRHTHASHLVSSGLSLSIVGKLLGHTQASTTQRYAHLADTPLREATSFFGSKISKLTG